MFWRKSRVSASDPDQLKNRLVRLFRKSGKGDLFTLDDIVDVLNSDLNSDPVRKDIVAFLLAKLTSDGVIDQLIRVASPRGGGIGDFASFEDVPSVIFDPFQREEITVRPQDIKVFFTKHNRNQGSGVVNSARTHAVA